MRDMVRVRKVGSTLVVTLLKCILAEIPVSKGDRMMIETTSDGRIVLTPEREGMDGEKIRKVAGEGG